MGDVGGRGGVSTTSSSGDRVGGGVGATARTRFLLIAACGLVLLGATYAVAVRTGAGQILDDWAFEGRKAINYDVRRTVTYLLSVAAVVIVAVSVAVECVVAVRRGRWPLAIGAVVVVGGAVLCAGWGKAALERPHLTDTLATALNTYPSGHMAAAVAAALWALVVSPPARRALVLQLAGPAATVVGIALIGSSSHRPSDVVGATALAVVWCGVVGAVLVRPEDAGGSGFGPLGLSGRRVALVTIVLVAAVTISLRLPANPQHRLWAYLFAVLAVAALVFVSLWALGWALAGGPSREEVGS